MSKEKTPMQQLKEKMEFALNKTKEDYSLLHPQYANGVIDTLTNVIADIQLQMIPIEKKCIIDFHCEVTEEGLKNESSEYLGKAKEIIKTTAVNSYDKTFTK